MKKITKNSSMTFHGILPFSALLILLMICGSTQIYAQGSKADFSGSWVLNAEKSNLGDTGGRRMGGGDFVATQEVNLLTVVSTRTNRDGESVTTTRKFTLDGKESVNEMRNFESKSTAKWSDDGKTLTIETVFSFNGNEMKSSEVWTMKDARTLSISSTRQGRNGEIKRTLIYDKK